MNFSLKPHQLVAHWVPGFVVLTMWLLADLHYANLHSSGSHPYIAFWTKSNMFFGHGSAVVLSAIVSFVVGQFLDSLRNWAEDFLDRKPESKIKWKMLKMLTKDELAIFEDYYFVYYVFSANLLIGLLIGFFVTIFLGVFPSDHYCLSAMPVAIGIIVFFRDARSLREEIRGFLNDVETNHKNNEKKTD